MAFEWELLGHLLLRGRDREQARTACAFCSQSPTGVTAWGNLTGKAHSWNRGHKGRGGCSARLAQEPAAARPSADGGRVRCCGPVFPRNPNNSAVRKAGCKRDPSGAIGEMHGCK